MRNRQTVAVILVAVAVLAVGAACGSDEAGPETGGLSPLAPEGSALTQEEPTEEPGDVISAQVSSGSMIARPDSVESLVAQSRIMVLGTISSVLSEKVMYYGEDGKPVAADEESGSPYTDYEVQIESILKADGGAEEGGTLVLRMFGHLSQQSDVVTLVPVQLPQPGSHYLLALGRNPDDTFGSGSEGLINVDGETVAFADGVAFPTELTGEEFVQAVRQEIGGKGLSATSIETTPTTSRFVLTEDNFRELLTVDDVETRLSVKVSLEADFRDFKEMAGRVEPSQVVKMDGWYAMSIEEAGGGPGMTFTVIDFDSQASAEDHYVVVMSEASGLQQMTPPIGDVSGQVEVNAGGIGSMIVFMSGDKFVSMHTAQSRSRAPLLSLEDLGELATLVANKL